MPEKAKKRVTRHANITHSEHGTSVFDPVLCELAYRWFCPPGGTIIDPFAGGPVRGVVAALCGRRYFGIDLSAPQIDANRRQAKELCSPPLPQWAVGDSRNILKLAAKHEADFVFSCPPYADLERYSDDPADLSTLEYPAFREAYFDIIAKTAKKLRPNRFACFVVGEVRDKASGMFYGLVGDTIDAFRSAGLGFYNDAVLVQPVGNQRLRVGKSFENSRKLGKTHQNVLIFCKGDPKKATEAVGEVEFGEVPEGEEEAA